jgi:hypothetical protein
LENGVCKYPALEGRFPMVINKILTQVSGFEFSFNPGNKYLQRVPFDKILINGSPVEREKIYTLTVRDYIFEGFDGYDELPNCENIDKTNDIATMFSVAIKFFELVKSLKEDSFVSSINDFEPGSFGFDQICESVFGYMRKVIVFNNNRSEVLIDTPSRIHKIDC